MHWRIFGMFMIIPTLGFAIFITARTRNIKSQFLNNLAVVFWITANSFWMITEFIGKEDQLKKFALIPFGIGIFIILYGYSALLIKTGYGKS